MKLNHLNLTVSNVPDAHRFLEKYFGLRGYNGMEPREAMSFMSDDSGMLVALFRFFFQAEDGIRDADVTGVQTCALPI